MNTLAQVICRIFFIIFLIMLSFRTTAGEAEDSSLARDIRTQFAGNNNLTNTHIDIKSDNGVITLSGMVDSPLQEKAAIETAETVRGVKSVQSYITVRGTETPQIEVEPTKTVVVPGNAVSPSASIVNPDVETVVVPAVPTVSTGVPPTVATPAGIVPASSTVVVPTQTVPATNAVVVPVTGTPASSTVVVPTATVPATDTVIFPTATVPATNTVVVPTATVPTTNTVVVPASAPASSTVIVPEQTTGGQPNLMMPNLPPLTPQVPGALQP